MIYCYTYIPNHPAYEVHEAISHFINDMDNQNQCRFVNIFTGQHSWFLDVINATDVLAPKLRAVFRAYKRITIPNIQTQIINSFNYWNEIENRCGQNLVNQLLWDDLPPGIKTPIFNLFRYLYNELTKQNDYLENNNKLRIQHYRQFFESNGRICKTCAIRPLDSPEVQINSYDHYLQISKYPYLGINYKNIVPICDKCNEAPGKGKKHVLYANYNHRARRLANFPYEQNVSKTVSMSISRLFVSNPRITLSYTGSSQAKIDTWRKVFNIDRRFKAEIKDNKVIWIDELVHSNRNSVRNTIPELVSDINGLLIQLRNKVVDLNDHLKIAFWTHIIAANHVDLEDLRTFINGKRAALYGAT